MQDVSVEQNLVSLGHKKQWKDVEGNPTDNEDVTHWDENGFLEIREEVPEEVKVVEKVDQLINNNSASDGQFGSVIAPKVVNEDELDDFARMQRKFYGLDQGLSNNKTKTLQQPIKI